MHGEHTQLVRWSEAGRPRQARWATADGRPSPRSVVVADRDLTADQALRQAAEGIGLIWRGDYHQARQLLDAMKRRLRLRPPRRELSAAEEFHRRRQHRARTARLLGSLLVELHPGWGLRLRRAPDVASACRETYGESSESRLLVLRELLGVLNVHRRRGDGIPVAVLGGQRIHPHYGVFSPTRQDYLELVADAPLPAGAATGFDVGTGTGVIAALLRHRGIANVVATDHEPRAVACAQDNLDRLGLDTSVHVHQRNLFPRGRADLVVANPPWLPATPANGLESGVYDPRGAMTSQFVGRVAEHLRPEGEAWLILSDLAEHIGLRPVGYVPAIAAGAGLRVLDHAEVRPTTGSRRDRETDALDRARHHERIHLWRFSRQP